MKVDSNGDMAQMNAMLYHDNSALATIRQQAGQQGALKTVAGQFEAMFLQMVLRQMRSSSDVLAPEDNPFSSKEQGVYRDFYDGQLAIELAKKQRSGIADMLIKQLSPTLPHASQALSQMPVSHATAPQTAANDSVGLGTAAVTTPSSDEGLAAFNDTALAAAYDPRVSFRQMFQESMGTVAFQQPLIHKVEL